MYTKEELQSMPTRDLVYRLTDLEYALTIDVLSDQQVEEMQTDMELITSEICHRAMCGGFA